MKEDVILMAHGGGGVLTRQIIDDLIVKTLGNPILNKLDDGACLSIPEAELVMTTDSFVVTPMFFPGGDIGRLAVCGTVNDLAMQGAVPRYMSLALIIEEGVLMRDLRRVLVSVKEEAGRAGVLIVTGDTKVVEQRRFQASGLRFQPSCEMFINTTGLGVRLPGVDVSVANAKAGDTVIVTGTIGDHGIAVMTRREGLDMESGLVSDVAALWGMVGSVLEDVPAIHCLRDPTRGGLAAALCDVARASACGIRIRESALPIRQEVRGACGLLGLDPLNVANEGKALVVCGADDTERVLKVLRSHELGRDAAVIGAVAAEPAGLVLLETRMGGERIVDIPTGEDLPRIC